MFFSTDHILTSHAGVLPRPEGLKETLLADWNAPAAQQQLTQAVKDVVQRQIDMGFDIVNDGEQSKYRGFSEYVRDRLSGIDDSKTERKRLSILARDALDFPGFVG